MGWRSTGAAFRAGNYSGPLTSDEGGFAAGFAKTFTAGISKAADIITEDMKADRDQEREKDLIRLRETLAAQRAGAAASAASAKKDQEDLAWANSAITNYSLENTPEMIARLAALRGSTGNDFRADQAVRELIGDGVLGAASSPVATPVAPVELEATISSQGTTDFPSGSNTPPTPPNVMDDLERTETTVAVASPVETPEVDVVETPVTPNTPQQASVSYAPLDENDIIVFNRLNGMSISELRTAAATSPANSYRQRAAQGLYQDRRTREIQATAEEATLLTIIQNGEDWERETAREVLQNMGSSNEITRFKILPEGVSPADLQTTGADVINVRMARGEDGRSVPVDVATGEPIDPARVVGPVTQDESERLVSILTAMNNPITAYQKQRNNLLGFADLSYEIGMLIDEDETVTTRVAGLVSSLVSGGREVSALYNVLSSTFDNDPNAVISQQDFERDLRRRGVLEPGETLDAIAGRLTVEDIFSDQTIALAERRRVFEAKMVLAAFRAGALEGQSGQAMSDKDFQRFAQFLNSAKTEGGFQRSVGEYLNNAYRQVMQAENDLLNDGRVVEFRSAYFRDPLNLTTTQKALEAEPRYMDALAYFGIIDAPQAGQLVPQSQEPEVSDSYTSTVNGVTNTLNANTAEALRNSGYSPEAIRRALINAAGFTEQQVRQFLPELFEGDQ
jgi:hypothetical protein